MNQNNSEKQNNNNNNDNSIVSNQNGNNIFEIICAILSVIVAILGIGNGIYLFYRGFTEDGILFNILDFVVGIGSFVYAFVIISLIWLFYGIINKIVTHYSKQSSNNKKF